MHLDLELIIEFRNSGFALRQPSVGRSDRLTGTPSTAPMVRKPGNIPLWIPLPCQVVRT